jgi:radical SAM family uncharacterized protein
MLDKLLAKVQKPARYTGGELGSITKDKNTVDVRFAFCFPDTYEVGMSHLGTKILYGLLNSRQDVWCERVFAPWVDMEEQMRENKFPLFAIESQDPIKDFDFIGFTLQYELCYTNMLNMLQLAEIPLLSSERKGLKQIVIVGGPCAYNCEPIADFVDIAILGEGEEVTCEVIDLYRKIRANNGTKEEFLIKASSIEGVYVPSLYNVDYNSVGTISSIKPKLPQVPQIIKKRIVEDLDKSYFPDHFIVPFIDIVHDRAILEVFRGCIRGCRFCQAGYIYRPVREKSSDVLNKQGKSICDASGYDEISLSSLSTSDYTELENLLSSLLEWTEKNQVNISLPSLRVDNFSQELLEKITKVRKSGLTFAPEGGTQRLRDAINKNVNEEELLNTCRIAFEGGYTSVKLYFMLGLPTETNEDIDGIADLAQKVVNVFYQTKNRPKGRGVNVTVSAACFVPKPFTPFEWEPQDRREVLIEKQRILINALKFKKIKCNWHDNKTSFLEAVFALGDRRLSAVLIRALELGCRMDGWAEHFKFDAWMQAFEDCGIDPTFYANRRRDFREILPWSHIDIGVDIEFLKKEAKEAYLNQTTQNCREKCTGCGANKLIGGACFEKRKGKV